MGYQSQYLNTLRYQFRYFTSRDSIVYGTFLSKSLKIIIVINIWTLHRSSLIWFTESNYFLEFIKFYVWYLNPDWIGLYDIPKISGVIYIRDSILPTKRRIEYYSIKTRRGIIRGHGIHCARFSALLTKIFGHLVPHFLIHISSRHFLRNWEEIEKKLRKNWEEIEAIFKNKFFSLFKN